VCVFERERERKPVCKFVCMCKFLHVYSIERVCVVCVRVCLRSCVSERVWVCVCVYSIEKCYIYTTRISAICDVVYAWWSTILSQRTNRTNFVPYLKIIIEVSISHQHLQKFHQDRTHAGFIICQKQCYSAI